MLKDITLGQYFPGNTAVHRLDPRTKLILTVVYIVILFAAKGVLAYGAVCVALLGIILASKTKMSLMLKSIKPVLPVLILTAILNILYTNGEKVLASFWIFSVTAEGIENAVYMLLRIVMLIMGTSILTYTTSPIALTDGLERLMSPLKKLKVPVHEMSMMMSIALRFIPTIIEETDKIMSAQKARGADFESGGLIKKAKAMLPILVPLFVSALRRADELAIAMESRCYHGGEGRTRMNVLKYRGSDALAFVLGAVFTAGVFLLNGVSL